MTTAERRKTRLSAFFVVCVACFVLCIAYIVLFDFADTEADLTFDIIKLAFMVFFSLVTLFIVGVTLLDAIRASKMVRTGTVTGKDVRSSRGTNADSLAQFVVMLDGTECTVDGDTFKKINVGESIVLTTSRSGASVLDLRVLSTVRSSSGNEERDVIEPMDSASRRVAWWAFVKSAFWRLLVVGFSALVPIIGLVVLFALDSSYAKQWYTDYVFKFAQIGFPLVVGVILLRHPWRIAHDLIGGLTLNEVRTIRDVVTSNRRLVGKTGLTSGWGDVTTYTYVDTSEGFLLCSPLPPPEVGKQVVISRLPHSRVLLGVYVLE